MRGRNTKRKTHTEGDTQREKHTKRKTYKREDI